MLFRSQRLEPSLACAPLPRRARRLAGAVRSRRPSAETVRRTWRASKGLLRGEGEGNGEEAAGAAAAAAAVAGAAAAAAVASAAAAAAGAVAAAAGAAATAAALAAGGGGWAATEAWEGEEQEISNLQESTARIPDVRSSILTLIELRG